MKNVIGKVIGGHLYVHRQYAPQSALDFKPGALALLATCITTLAEKHPGHKYVIVKINMKDRQVSFIDSPDFDTESEPTVGNAYLVKESGETKLIPQASDPWVYHGKHTMVGPDYTGFDVQREAEWHKRWNRELGNMPHAKIGKKSVWMSVKPKRENKNTSSTIGRTK